jgi:hypothetical protein
MDFTPILQAIIALASVLITSFLVPHIRTHTTSKNRETIKRGVLIAVSAAEQLFEPGTGDLKKQYVLNFLKKHGINIDQSYIDCMIEAAVYRLINQGPFSPDADSVILGDFE